jgi:archaemetzincin
MSIEIIGFRHYSKVDVKTLCKVVEDAFSVNVIFRKGILDIGLAYDSMRGQYSSNILLSLLKKVTGTNYANDKFMVITDLDLFVPILTYVFGEAEFNGNFGVVSSHRLHHEYYGLRENEFLLQTRIQKETIHGLGHNFGMLHCSNSKCVMHSSTYVEDIDNKDVLFCDSCKNQNKFV